MGTTSDKLTYLNTTKGKIKDVINMTGANITSETTFRNYATKLYDGYIDVLKDKNTLLDNMPKGTSIGAITDAADLPVYESKMSKESSQDTRILPTEYQQVEYIKSTGTQYIDTNYFANPNSSYELTLKFDNPKSDSEWRTSKTAFINSVDYENNVRNISINFGGEPRQKQELYIWRLMSQAVNSNIVGDIVLNKNVMSIKGTSFSYGQYTNTIPDSSYTVSQPLLLFAGRLIASGNTAIIFNAYDMYVYDFKIYENDILMRDLIPCYRKSDNKTGLYDYVNKVFYTNQGTGEFVVGNIVSPPTEDFPTPSPDYPQDVKTVKGYRNLFDKSAILDGYALNRNDNTLSASSSYRTSDYCEVEPNTTYYLGMYFQSSNYGILFYDENKTWLSSIAPASKFTTPANTKYVRFSWVKGNWDLDAIQLTESEEKLPYVPYGTNYVAITNTNGTDTNYYTIPLNDNEIAGIGDYKDELIVDKNGKCWLNKKTGKAVFDGSESSWQSQSFGTNSYSISISNMKPSINFNNDPIFVITNLFKGVKYDNRTTSGNNIIYSDTTNGAYIRNTTYTSLNDFKSMLQVTNLITYYVLATPELIDLNYTVDLTLFEGVNNISNSEDMDMEIKYIKESYE